MSAAVTTRRVRKSNGLTRRRGKLVVVSAATLICMYLCWRFAQPFLPALVWSVTTAVVTWPAFRWLGRWVRPRQWRALVAVSVVAVVILVPIASLVYFAAVQIADSVQRFEDGEYLARWQTALDEHPRLAQAWTKASQTLDLPAAMTRLIEQVRTTAVAIVSGSAYSLAQTLLMLFILFYLYRDGDRVLATVRDLAPLTDRETERLLGRLEDTIHATVLGTIAVALVQGLMGGFMFWILGLPAPALWGTVMGFLAIIPYLGTFVVWAPAAALLLMAGDWGKAIVLAAWGLVAIGLIDNLLYPILVGNRLKQHTVVTLIAIVGGIAVFGAAGVILGPVVVTLTVFLLEVWRHRTAPEAVAEAAQTQ